MIYFLNYTLGPYHIARYNQLEKLFPNRIIFIELASRVNMYPWALMNKEFNTLTLFPGENFENINPRLLATKVVQLLKDENPEVVISISYASAAMRQAAIWAKQNGRISVGISDSWSGDKPRYLPFEMLKGAWCRLFYDGMFLSGTRSKAYYVGLGFPEKRIWLKQNAVDNEYFASGSARVKKSVEHYRNAYQLPDKYFLCVARLSPEKNLKRLLTSYASYKRAHGIWDLVLVGSGPLEDELKAWAKTLGIEACVHFMGWRQVDEMPVFYGLASAFILPSLSETWGNVVNEAMASGLPVLVSEKCGCLPELCLQGINGFQFNPLNIAEITDSLLKISSGGCNVEKMGEKSKEIIAVFSTENYAFSLSDAITTLERQHRVGDFNL
jgi:1,2-diacylglycerol 3-alpha-glucosyltransferase